MVIGDGPIAQLAEHWTFNPLVVGSSPTGFTNQTVSRRGGGIGIHSRLKICRQLWLASSSLARATNLGKIL